MSESRIDSQGFRVGRWYVPPFSLGHGECISLGLPTEALADGNRIVGCLTGSESTSGLSLRAKIVLAEPASSPIGWRRWFTNQTPFDWLRKNTDLSEDTIRSFLREHGIDEKTSLDGYAGTPRALLGLQAAFARKPDVIVFSTAGLDPCGVRAVNQMVLRHLPECSAMNLAWPFISREKVQHNWVPGSRCISIIDTTCGEPRPKYKSHIDLGCAD